MTRVGQNEPWNRVLISLDDATMDRIIDDLTERAGYKRGYTSPLNLARWDLKSVLREHSLRGRGDD
jgi:hypothetical protein